MSSPPPRSWSPDMLLAIDSGNTNIVFAVFEGEDRRIPMRDSFVSPESRDFLAAAAGLRNVVNRTGSESAESVAGAVRYLLEGTGHMPHMERPTEVQAAIEEAIARAG